MFGFNGGRGLIEDGSYSVYFVSPIKLSKLINSFSFSVNSSYFSYFSSDFFASINPVNYSSFSSFI